MTVRGSDCDEVAWAAPGTSSPYTYGSSSRGATAGVATPINPREDPTILSDVPPAPTDAAAKSKAETNRRADSPPAPPPAEPDQNAVKNQNGQLGKAAAGGGRQLGHAQGEP